MLFAVTWSPVQNSKQGVPQSALKLRLETYRTLFFTQSSCLHTNQVLYNEVYKQTFSLTGIYSQKYTERTLSNYCSCTCRNVLGRLKAIHISLHLLDTHSKKLLKGDRIAVHCVHMYCIYNSVHVQLTIIFYIKKEMIQWFEI